MHKPLVLTLNIIGQTGTAILLTIIIITILMSKKVNFKDAGRLFALHLKSCDESSYNLFDLSNLKITTYGGLSAAMGQAIKAGMSSQFYHQS